MKGAQPRRLFRGELDWIVMKALDKDRERRYDSASAFAQDIRCFLFHDPIPAFSRSPFYRVRKFAQRNKTAIALAAIVFLVLMLCFLVSAWWVVSAKQAESQAESNETNAIARERTAQAALRLACRPIGFVPMQVGDFYFSHAWMTLLENVVNARTVALVTIAPGIFADYQSAIAIVSCSGGSSSRPDFSTVVVWGNSPTDQHRRTHNLWIFSEASFAVSPTSQ